MKVFTNETDNQKIIAIALSGGVDSFVAAHQLKQQGREVIGVHMQNWIENTEPSSCRAEQDLLDAKVMAEQLNIPLIVVNFSKEYWHRVFERCLDEFAEGYTPNPDVWCNREIKFKTLLDYVHTQGADLLATGHYARIEHHDGQFYLLKSYDTQKDQTYFLYLLTQSQLAVSRFPVGGLQKSVVRQIAQRTGSLFHNKKDSTGICFIGERKFKTFLQDFLLTQPGNIETPEGKILGKHGGIAFYTIGQRQGLCLGGKNTGAEKPWYVLKKDRSRNVLIVGQGNDHPLLYTKYLTCHQVHWISGNPPVAPQHSVALSAKTRYRQPDQVCEVQVEEPTVCTVSFELPQRAVTPGQSVVFYQGERCLGGGIIQSTQDIV